MRYDYAEPILKEVEEGEATLPAMEARAQCQALRAAAAALQDDSLQAAELAESRRARSRAADAWTENVISNVMRYVHWNAARWSDVYEQPWQPYSLEDDPRNVFSTVYCEALLACVESEQARFGVAERHEREALRLAELHSGRCSVAAAVAAPPWAMIAYERGDLGAAEAVLKPLVSLIDTTAMHESVLRTYLVLARIARAGRDPEQAYALLEHAESIGYNRGWDRLVGAMLLERLRWLCADGRLDEARACGVQLRRLAANHVETRLCARSDLAVYRDWGQAHLAFCDQNGSKATDGFAWLCADARAPLRASGVAARGFAVLGAYGLRRQAWRVRRPARGPATGTAQRGEPYRPRFRRRRAGDASALSCQRSAGSALGPLRAAPDRGQWGGRLRSRRRRLECGDGARAPGAGARGSRSCQSARKIDPLSASKIDPLDVLHAR